MKHKLDDDTWFPFFFPFPVMPSVVVLVLVVVKLSSCRFAPRRNKLPPKLRDTYLTLPPNRMGSATAKNLPLHYLITASSFQVTGTIVCSNLLVARYLIYTYNQHTETANL